MSLCNRSHSSDCWYREYGLFPPFLIEHRLNLNPGDGGGSLISLDDNALLFKFEKQDNFVIFVGPINTPFQQENKIKIVEISGGGGVRGIKKSFI